jgi:hypothetical protein
VRLKVEVEKWKSVAQMQTDKWLECKDRLKYEVAMIDNAAKDETHLLNNTIEILNKIRDNLQDENMELKKAIDQSKMIVEMFKDENKHLKTELQVTKKQLELSQRSVKILTDALSFYSSVRNWELASDPQGDQARCIIDPVDHEELEDNWGDVEWIGGKRARAALEQEKHSQKWRQDE